MSDNHNLPLIIGGAGFVGTNVAERYLKNGMPVLLFDNLSRPGVEANMRYLCETFGDKVELIHADVRDGDAIRRAVARASVVYHLAAQVAVTTSLTDPVADFEINARGTLNLLEAIRALPPSARPPLLFTSTNKVYGDLEDVALRLAGDTGRERYAPEDSHLRLSGVGETRPLDFHSPYGCSKGAADQYVLDYARTFGLQAVVFRMSCIYGPHQCGNEDQGWVAHFARQALRGEPVTLYGDGKQVRDALFVHDLLDAFDLALKNIVALGGRAFNIGGGPDATTSLIELIARLEALTSRKIPVDFGPWRAGDQRWYVSDTRAFTHATGWRPRVSVDEGVRALCDWLGKAFPVSPLTPLAPSSPCARPLSQAKEGVAEAAYGSSNSPSFACERGLAQGEEGARGVRGETGNSVKVEVAP